MATPDAPAPAPPAPPGIASEIARLVAALDEARLQREYWEQDEFLFVPGFLPPAVHIRDNLELAANAYRITLKGVGFVRKPTGGAP